MKQKALVLSTEGDSAVIEVARVTACEGCHKLKEGEGCVACSLFDLKRKMTATAVNEIGANPGDVVYISTPSRTVLFYSAVVFILPIAIGILFYFFASLFTDITAIPALVSVAAVILTFVVIHFTLDRSVSGKKMIRIISVCRDNTDIIE